MKDFLESQRKQVEDSTELLVSSLSYPDVHMMDKVLAFIAVPRKIIWHTEKFAAAVPRSFLFGDIWEHGLIWIDVNK